MKKRGRLHILLRILLAIIVTPMIVITLIISLLYIPRVQRAVVEKACREISAQSGYDVGIGSILLSFPLKLKATDFTMSRNDSVYFSGRSLGTNISLTPLFAGKVEVNYISLEALELNTRDILPDMLIEGKVGYARVVARDADLANAVADIRQLYIADSDIHITMTDTTTAQESEPLEWLIRLHKGRVKNCGITVSMPHDTLDATAYIGSLRLRGGSIDIATTSLALKSLALNGARIEYDKGSMSAAEAPLDHIRLGNINLQAGNLRYAGFNDISAEIAGLTLQQQPTGIAITDVAMHLTSSNDTLRLQGLNIESRNGSRIGGHATIPHKALENPDSESLTATLVAAISKPDLAGYLPTQLYESLHWFNDRMLNATLSLSGNIDDIAIDTLALDFPGLGTVNADGYIRHLPTDTLLEGCIAFNAGLNDIKRFIDTTNDSIDGRADATGNISYSRGEISADMALHCAGGSIAASGSYNIADTAYSALVDIDSLALAELVPDVPLHKLKMHLDAKGCGTDIFGKRMKYEVNAVIDTLYYADYKLRSIEATASQANNVSLLTLRGNDNSLLFGIDATTVLKRSGISNHTAIELTKADFKEIGAVDSTLKLSTSIALAATTDFKESHSLKIDGNGTTIEMLQNSFTPGNLSLDFATTPRGTDIKVQNGDLNINGKMDCGYRKLFAAIEKISRMNRDVMSGKSTLPHLHDYQEVLPDLLLTFNCGEENVLHNALAFAGIEAGDIKLEADISHERGININGNIFNLGTSGTRLDSIGLYTSQEGDRLDYTIMADGLTIKTYQDQNSHNARLYGYMECDTLTTNMQLRNNIDSTESRLGLTTLLSPGNMDIRFTPDAMLFGEPFSFGDYSYINIGKTMSIDADVSFTGEDDNGFYLYTIPDGSNIYNINLDIFNLQLASIMEAMPDLPDLSGSLFAKFNYRKESLGDIFTGNVDIEELACDGNAIGNEKIELVYFPKSNSVHDISCTLSHNRAEVARIKSDYQHGVLNGNIALTRLPLAITQAFIDKEGVMLDGYLEGRLDFSGELTDMKSNGYLRLDSTYAYSPMLGAMLHPSDEKIMIENSRINLRQYHIYDKVNTPFVIDGNVDIKNLLDPKVNLKLNATNYEVLNTPHEKGKMVYGKMYVDLRSMLRGTLNDVRMDGDLTILSSSDFAYIMPEAAMSSSKDLDGLVEFVNFNDTTTIQTQEDAAIDLGDITANLNLIVKDGAKLSVYLDNMLNNYVSIEGAANLNAAYDNRSGFNVTGVYKLNSGEVKLTLPIIPLKTFYIQEGSRLTWTGDMFNPTLNVTALEKTNVSVEMDDNSVQQVEFNAGVVVSNDLNNLAVDFTMSAPDNSVIQNQLNELDRATLSRYAIAMIITGSYLGGRQGVTATSALSAFLDAKINQLSGTAIKDFDVNIGINDAMNAETGNAYTNYSFSFSKRFLNDRITVVIGGEVNSGDRPDKSAGNETFINNISLEWKLNQAGNRYIRIFYDKNYQSLLEGEITETGVGYVYKRKLNSLRELFIFKRKAKKQQPDETPKRESEE